VIYLYMDRLSHLFARRARQPALHATIPAE
jgi:hypothetical protein